MDRGRFAFKSVASVATLGSGCSLGPEGPAVEIGTGVSRVIAEEFKFPLGTSWVLCLARFRHRCVHGPSCEFIWKDSRLIRRECKHDCVWNLNSYIPPHLTCKRVSTFADVQHVFISAGCAAGVAAGFNAPLAVRMHVSMHACMQLSCVTHVSLWEECPRLLHILRASPFPVFLAAHIFMLDFVNISPTAHDVTACVNNASEAL